MQRQQVEDTAHPLIPYNDTPLILYDTPSDTPRHTHSLLLLLQGYNVKLGHVKVVPGSGARKPPHLPNAPIFAQKFPTRNSVTKCPISPALQRYSAALSCPECVRGISVRTVRRPGIWLMPRGVARRLIRCPNFDRNWCWRSKMIREPGIQQQQQHPVDTF